MTRPVGFGNFPERRICAPGNKGFFLPGIPEDEESWHTVMRAVLYGVSLLYCFLGVSIIADVFMESIEQITRTRKRVRMKETGRVITVYVWNGTVANLTLMALGSSAPEILLSVIELAGNDMFSGSLGPSTIVGSAAFNLLVIISVCIMSIPDGDVRYIQEQGVFFLTAVWSLFAYVWVVLIVDWWSPGKVDIVEGVLTFAFMPIMVIHAYVVDRWEMMQMRRKVRMQLQQNTAGESFADSELGSEVIGSTIGSQISTWSVMQEMELRRPGVPRRLGSGVRMLVASERKRTDSSLSIGGSINRCSWIREPDIILNFKFPCHMVDTTRYNFAQVTIIRSDKHLEQPVQVKYETQKGVCDPETDFEPLEGVSQFPPQELENTYQVNIRESAREHGYFKISLHEATLWQDFEVGASRKLAGPMRKAHTMHEYTPTISIGQPGVTYVVLNNREFTGENGVLSFGSEEMTVQGGTYERVVFVPVFRFGGLQGPVMCSYRTERLTAVPGYDYEEDEGTLSWQPGENVQEIAITVLPKKLGEANDQFQIILEKGTGGVKFNPYDDGGEDMCILTLTIDNEHRTKKFAGSIFFYTLDRVFNMDFLTELSACWAEQVVIACLCNGTIEGQKEATVGDWTIHLAVLPWKLFYAVFAPPPVAPWCCFLCALAHIGLITALVCDLAQLFGCVLDIDDSVTAITFVALGTSLPDLFASRTAAMQDDYADASIVNVTGSNAVNVFLGIGITWSIGAVYWNHKGGTPDWRARYGSMGHAEGTFVVIKGKITFTTCVFIIAAVACLLVLIARRKAFGGELGGPHGAKVLSAVVLVLLWCWYVGLSVWNSSGDRTGTEQAMMILAASTMLGAVLLLTGLGMNLFKAMTVDNRSPQSSLTESDKEEEELQSKLSEEKEKDARLLSALMRYIPSRLSQGMSRASTGMSISSLGADDKSVGSDVQAILGSTEQGQSKQHHRSDKEPSYAQMLYAIQDMKSEIVRWTDRFEKCEKFMRLPSPRDVSETDL